MILRKMSPISHKYNAVTLPISSEKYLMWCKEKERFIEEVFPELTEAQREFMISGITPEEYEDLKQQGLV